MRIKNHCLDVECVPYDKLQWTQDVDLKEASKEDFGKACKSFLKHGIIAPWLVWGKKGSKPSVLDGHFRQAVIRFLVEKEGHSCDDLPIVRVEGVSTKKKALELIGHTSSRYHKITQDGMRKYMAELGWEDPAMLEQFAIPEFDYPKFKASHFEEPSIPEGTDSVEHQKLADRFLVPPFSVLDARQGYWQDRKRQWLELGIKSEVGRSAPTGGGQSPLVDIKQGNPQHGTLGAIPSNEKAILKRTGKYK